MKALLLGALTLLSGPAFAQGDALEAKWRPLVESKDYSGAKLLCGGWLTGKTPIEIVEGEAEPGPGEALPLYEFEPSVDAVLDILLPRYVTSRINTCLLSAATSELASRQRAMKSATDNADALIKTYTRLSNQARQSEITQEISEIVGGAEALTSHR